VAHVRDILKETGLEPQYQFELTETAFMQDLESTAAVLCQLKDIGIRDSSPLRD
jgi:EAL domain-containing protein (putative c-di-GMP-specific phosphodiesterase class I)